MKAYSKHINWGQLKITKDTMERYVMPKYGKTNWRKDDSWTDIILDDVYDTFYRDKEQETEVAKKFLTPIIVLMVVPNTAKNDKGKGNVHDIQNRLGELKVDLARAIKARQVDDHDDDLDTLDLGNKIKS
nr:hypothetical protein [Tanacetum cinerariifolium]